MKTGLKENLGAAGTASEASINNTQSKHVERKVSLINLNSQEDLNVIHASSKKCSRCCAVKSLTEFAKNMKTDDGYLKTCFACSRPRNAVKRSLRSAINTKCKECIYDPIAGGGSWKQQVAACTSPACPLYDVRPGGLA